MASSGSAIYNDIRTLLVEGVEAIDEVITAPFPANAPDQLVSMRLLAGAPTQTRFGAVNRLWWRTVGLLFQSRGHVHDPALPENPYLALDRLVSVADHLAQFPWPRQINENVYRRITLMTEPHYLRQDEQERPIYQCRVELEVEATPTPVVVPFGLERWDPTAVAETYVLGFVSAGTTALWAAGTAAPAGGILHPGSQITIASNLKSVLRIAIQPTIPARLLFLTTGGTQSFVDWFAETDAHAYIQTPDGIANLGLRLVTDTTFVHFLLEGDAELLVRAIAFGDPFLFAFARPLAENS